MNIKEQDIEELKQTCQEIRNKIISVVSKNGGHLSSNIGAVELIVAMHYVFDYKSDPFIFDVSHQAYTHKLLTNRWDSFDTLRQFGGLSGYTKPKESEADYFIAGHSSTSISLAIGAAKAFKLRGQKRVPIAFIGDGAMSAGMAYEALNELGDRKYPVIIVLNDNEMSISKPIGAISRYLSQTMAKEFYQSVKNKIEKTFKYLPESAVYMAKKFEESFRLISPGFLFEELGLEYIGPVDGHDLKSLIETFKIAKTLNKPVVIHAQTLKGKGYEIAEGQKEQWHGVGAFDIKSGQVTKKSIAKPATLIFSEHLYKLANEHENIVGVTAAMPSGTGMDKLIEAFPERFWDVAIAEQHAVTSMAAMAKEGFKPFVAIYSTFLQRAYDQIIHDCCILNVPIVFAIDRAGIVGEDGETHQGVFDINYLHVLPNITLLAPRSEEMLRFIMDFAYFHEGVCAFRYPRGAFRYKDEEAKKIEFSKSQILSHGKDIALLSYGSDFYKADAILKDLKTKWLNPSLIDLIFIKPLDEEMLKNLALSHKIWFVFSSSAKAGGVGEILSSFLHENNLFDIKIHSFEYEDKFISHGNLEQVEQSLSLDISSIKQKIYQKLDLKNA